MIFTLGRASASMLRLSLELDASLLGSADALIKDKKHFLIVPSGPLTALPFHLLVTQKAASVAKDSSVFGIDDLGSARLMRQPVAENKREPDKGGKGRPWWR
jgi:hypothetical protein